MKNRKLWPQTTIFDIKPADQAHFAALFARFDTHKNTLISHLCVLHDQSCSNNTFDENIAWHGLLRTAYWFFRRHRQAHGKITAARRRERLLEFAEALGTARNLLINAMSDDVGFDVYRGWCAEMKSSFASKHTLVDGKGELPWVDEIKDLTERLNILSAGASKAGQDIPVKRGAPRGTGLLSMHDIIALAAVYRTNTRQTPTLNAGPFSEFIEMFLVAAGHSNVSSNDYVFETFDYFRKQNATTLRSSTNAISP